jgi:hypothetical protein
MAMCTMPGVHRDEVVGAEGLGDHRGIRAEAAFHQVVRALATLRLARHAGDDEIAGQPRAGAADGLGGHDDAGQAPLHVLHAVTVQSVTLERGRPRIPPPAPGQRVDVGVAVQHEAGPTARAPQRGDRLQAPRLDFLQVDLVATLSKELVEEPGDGRLLGLEAGNADERAGQVDQLSRIDGSQHRTRQVVHEARDRAGVRLPRRATGSARRQGNSRVRRGGRKSCGRSAILSLIQLGEPSRCAQRRAAWTSRLR